MSSSDVKVPRLLTVKQLSAVTGLPKWRIHELIAQDKGPPHLRIGRTLRFAEDAVVKWIEQQQSNRKERHHEQADA